MAHHFICPSCGNRSAATDRNAGFRSEPKGCEKCGFGFLFELLEDYYAGPATALIVCDAERRIIAAGHAATPVTGFREGDLIGHEVVSRLGLGNFPKGDPAATAMEWGVRQLNVDCTFRPAGVDHDQPVTEGRSAPVSRVWRRASLRASTIAWRSTTACPPSVGTRSMTSITRWKRSRSLSMTMSNGVVVVPSSL